MSKGAYVSPYRLWPLRSYAQVPRAQAERRTQSFTPDVPAGTTSRRADDKETHDVGPPR